MESVWLTAIVVWEWLAMALVLLVSWTLILNLVAALSRRLPEEKYAKDGAFPFVKRRDPRLQRA